MPERSSLKEDGFTLAHGFREISVHHSKENMVGHIHAGGCMYQKDICATN